MLPAKHLIQCLAFSEDANCLSGVGSPMVSPMTLPPSNHPCIPLNPPPMRCGWDLAIASNQGNPAKAMDITS